MDLDIKKLKEKLRNLPKGYDETLAKEFGCSSNYIRWVRYECVKNTRNSRQNTKNIVLALVKLAHENSIVNPDISNEINKLL